MRFELAGGVKAATSAGMRVAHEDGPLYNPGASLALAFGAPRITHFHDLLQIRIDPPADSLSSNNSRIRPTSSRQNLNIAGYTDVTDAEVVATTT